MTHSSWPSTRRPFSPDTIEIGDIPLSRAAVYTNGLNADPG